MKCLLKVWGSLFMLFLIMYLVCSAGFSYWVNTNRELAYDIIEQRSPFLIVEVITETVEGYDMRNPYAMTDDGFYIEYDNDVKIGSVVTSWFLWNPLNNYCDDIICRFDYVH